MSLKPTKRLRTMISEMKDAAQSARDSELRKLLMQIAESYEQRAGLALSR